MMQPLQEGKAARVRFPKCRHCGRRPTLRRVPGADVEADDGRGGKIRTPRYELLPCCSARYVKTVEGPTRSQRLAAAESWGKR